MMIKVHAVVVRDFLNFPSSDLTTCLTGKYHVLFEDGVVRELTAKEIIVSRYFWALLIDYPNLPLISEYVVSNYHTNNTFTGKTPNKFLSKMLHAIIYKILVPQDILSHDVLDTLSREMYLILEALYSDLQYNILEYVTSLNIVDLLAIQMDEDLLASMKNVETSLDASSVEASYNTLDWIIRNKPEFKHNPVARAYISGMVNSAQVKQVLGPRGYVTEIDSSIYKYPIASSFTLGMQNLYDMAAESRSGAKALFLSNKAIQDSEYFARELQLATMTTERLVFADCGNDDYIDWYVKPPEIANPNTPNERVIYAGDLPNLKGKHFFNETMQTEDIIMEDMTHLYGTVIKIRAVMNCRLPDKHSICSKCFGELAYGVPKHSNVGHLCSTTLSAQLSQLILSTKHLTSSASSNDVILDNMAKKFFNVKDKNGYSLKPEWIKNRKVSLALIISQEQCYGIKDLRRDKSINKINPARTTRIEDMTVLVTRDGKREYFPIMVREGNRYASLELKFLKYLVEEGFTTDESGNYIIDITNWRYASPILRLPEVEFSFFVLGREIKSLLKTRTTSVSGLSNETPESLISKLFSLVNSKLNISLPVLEVIADAFTVRDLLNDNFDMSRNSHTKELTDLKTLIDSRSMGAGYGYNNFTGKIMNPIVFKSDDKPDHPLDVLIKPIEVMRHYNSIKS